MPTSKARKSSASARPKAPRKVSKSSSSAKLSLKNSRAKTGKSFLASAKKAVYVGSTTNPAARLQAHAANGFRGKMVAKKVDNMRAAENKLLKATGARHNTYNRSGVAAAPGFVYKIEGQKRKV